MDEDIARNIEQVQQRIAAACRCVGRSPTAVTLVAVTKTVPPERIRAAWDLGIRHFGENRVQEARAKMPLLRDLPIVWHMVGHLQSNKAGQAADLFDMIESVDSVALAERLSRRVAGQGRSLPILLEVNVGAEQSKFGFSVREGESDTFLAAVEQIVALPGLDVQGLMTVAPIVADPELVRPHFRRLRTLLQELRQRWPQRSWLHLSMGMTDDYEVALEEGATIIRLGRAIFGPRPG